MQILTIALGAASGAAAVLSVIHAGKAEDGPASAIASVGVFALALLSWLVVWLVGENTAPALFPIMDFPAGMIFIYLWTQKPRAWWRLSMAVTYAAQCLAHAVFLNATDVGAGFASNYSAYAVIICAIFVLQVMIAGWNGLFHGLEDLLDWVFGSARIHDHVCDDSGLPPRKHTRMASPDG